MTRCISRIRVDRVLTQPFIAVVDRSTVRRCAVGQFERMARNWRLLGVVARNVWMDMGASGRGVVGGEVSTLSSWVAEERDSVAQCPPLLSMGDGHQHALALAVFAVRAIPMSSVR
jgi:hypothetical protein